MSKADNLTDFMTDLADTIREVEGTSEPINPQDFSARIGGLSTGGGGMQSVTYAELKALRDNGQLVAGRQYRITDYVTTTSQENTRSAGHPFDIIVTADSESVLNENARAIQHEEILDVDASEGGILKTGAVTKYYDIFEDFDDEKGTDYKANDVFVECGYAENNEGETVPVLYKTDVEMMEEGADYDDAYFYVGRYEYNGETYDRWRKIEANEDTEIKWDSEGKIYALTNIIVDDNGVFNPNIIATSSIDLYFKKAKLSAWELKYSLDNDNTRFVWAQDKTAFMCVAGEETYIYVRYTDGDNENGVAWAFINDSSNLQFTDIQDWTDIDSSDLIYTQTENVSIGEIYDMSGEDVTVVDLYAGKGVVYYMKDEWDNECPYDFKNIQFVRTADWFTEHEDWCNEVLGYIPEEDMWFYTFTWVDENNNVQDLIPIGNTLRNDTGFISGVFANKMGLTTTNSIYIEGEENSVLALSNNIIVNSFYYYDIDRAYYGCYSNIFGNDCNNNTFGNNCHSNTFGDYCRYSTFGNDCYSNTFGNGCYSNTFGNNCHSNTFGDYCRYSTFGNDCYSNTFGNGCYSNTFGKGCYSNTFGNDCNNNTFGNNCYSNTFGTRCRYNTFDSTCYSNTFGDYCNNNTFGGSCRYNTFDNSCLYNTFGDYCDDNTFGDSCHYNIFGDYCNNNTFGNDCRYNTFGGSCRYNTFDDSADNNETTDYCKYIILEKGVRYIHLETDNTAGNNENCVQNVKVRLSVHGSSTTNPLVLNVDRNNDFETEFVSANKETIEV